MSLILLDSDVRVSQMSFTSLILLDSDVRASQMSLIWEEEEGLGTGSSSHCASSSILWFTAVIIVTSAQGSASGLVLASASGIPVALRWMSAISTSTKAAGSICIRGLIYIIIISHTPFDLPFSSRVNRLADGSTASSPGVDGAFLAFFLAGPFPFFGPAA